MNELCKLFPKKLIMNDISFYECIALMIVYGKTNDDHVKAIVTLKIIVIVDNDFDKSMIHDNVIQYITQNIHPLVKRDKKCFINFELDEIDNIDEINDFDISEIQQISNVHIRSYDVCINFLNLPFKHKWINSKKLHNIEIELDRHYYKEDDWYF